MPESKWEQNRHRNEEVANFLDCGDARGPGWLAVHPADRDRAVWALQNRSPLRPGTPAEDSPRNL
jgi:hypothetical protein